MTNPRVRSYDPAFGYELATIVEHGLGEMLERGEDVMYYLTVTNEEGPQPPRPDGCAEQILRGMYLLRESDKDGDVRRVQLLASGAMVAQALKAQRRLAEDYGVTANVWSVTSWVELHRDAVATQRADLLQPADAPRRPFVAQCLGADPGAVVAVTDYLKALPATVAPWTPAEVMTLGTDGFGRSDDRPALRDFFEVDERYITLAALVALARSGRIPWGTVSRAMNDLDIDPEKADPSRT